jgi:hypothetical protein
VLNLVASTALLQLVTGSPVSAIGVHATFVDITVTADQTVVTPKPQNTSITTAATTPIVSPPAAGSQRNVKFLSVNNSSASPCTVTVQHFDGATTADVFGPIPLLAGYTLQYNSDGRGFVLYDNLGNIL